MKRLIIFFDLIFLSFIFSSGVLAQQSNQTEAKFSVPGVCEQCKARIENAAYIKGVKFCEWNIDTQTLKVVYNSDKVSLESIQNSIASAGHNAGNIEADSIAYKKLPSCCAYRDGVQVH
ncbi:MAG: cation transporter [Bacteroidota bacterium]|nr:MAG: cation transporter [Bacteroidota bacterium]